jgi:hypothetical protein
MRKNSNRQFAKILLFFFCISIQMAHAQVIISQYYEGASTNKWIELTNLGSTSVNTASPQLKLGIWSLTGSAGTINITGAPSQTLLLNISIPPKGTILIGNTGNGTEISYLSAASAAQTSNTVINFNGNDGIALLDAADNIIDQFGQGVNAVDISYVRSTSVTLPSATYVPAQWTSSTLAGVNAALFGNSVRLGYHLSNACSYPLAQPTTISFIAANASSISGSFVLAAGVDEYLVIQSTSATLTQEPVDGIAYNVGASFGGGIIIGHGASNTFSGTGLSSSTAYYYFVYAVNSNCIGGPLYLTNAPLTASTSTTSNVCSTPASQPSSLSFGNTSTTSIAGSFSGSGADEYLVLMSTSSSFSASLVNGTTYNPGTTIGNATVISRGPTTTFTASNLIAGTTYYFYVFSISSNCIGGTKYLSAAPLTGSKATSTGSSGTLNYYFGNLHCHSSYSDGNADDVTKIPTDDYAFAKNSMCMDFLGISEHNHILAGMHLSDWEPGKLQAAAATTSTFVALHGMEWGVISGGGHVIVYGMDSLVGWDAGQYQVYVPKSVYRGAGGLFEILNRHGGNALGYLAHPNSSDYNDILNSSFDMAADDAIVGSTVETGPAFSINNTYTEPGSPMADLGYFQGMLAKGYHLGPTIDHDNHNMTFGRTAKTRLAILASALNENNLLDAMRRMRFYATEDCNARVSFSVNSQPMGSIIAQPGIPQFSVSCTTTSPVSNVKIMYGVPGSGSTATTLYSSNTASFTYSDAAILNYSDRYYYLDITETDGTRIVTAPVWYNRNDAIILAAPSVSSFFTINEKDRVALKWTTQNEGYNCTYFIERSTDMGKTYASIGTLRGKGQSAYTNSYALTDLSPFPGLAFYRLAQQDNGGQLNYSDVKWVDRGGKEDSYFSVYPNPAVDFLSIKLFAAALESISMDLYDICGRKLKSQPLPSKKGAQQASLNMADLKGGTYVLKIKVGAKTLTQLVNKR